MFIWKTIEGIVPGIESDWRLYGKPDGIIATGRREPEKPFFTFQEYKRELDPNGDPAGQALAAMLVGQRINDAKKSIYGCYVVGYDWRFITLTGTQYAISQNYSAITDAIFGIYRILKALKEIGIELTA